MGKTHDDEVYEKGVREGQRGGFLDDLVMGNILATSKDEKIFKDGYNFGAQHRYGPEGHYHTWDGKGSNDSKSEGTPKSEVEEDEIDYDEDDDNDAHESWGGSSNYEDRHYTTRDSSASQLETKPMPALMKWLIGLGIVGAISIGLRSYTNNPQEKPGVEVARKYNINERSLIERSLDFSRLWLSESSEKYRRDIALYRLKNHKKQITPELEANLIILRKLMESKTKEIRFNDYTQFENNIWVAGESRSDKGAYFGYMWHSPDCGNTWFWQLRIGPWLQRYNFGGTPDIVPFGIYFFDSKEGWSFTQNIIFHTTDGGKIWNQSYVHNLGKLDQLYIIDRQNLVAMKRVPTVIETASRTIHSYIISETQMVYTLNGGRTWENYPEWKPEILGLEEKLIEDSSIKLETPYK